MSDNEWYTPSRYIEAARTVMSSIDLDPASCELANKTVQATRYYSIEENGLKQEWYGNIWLNPPYGKKDGKSNLSAFIRKLVAHYEDRSIKQAIALIPTNTATSWFLALWDYIVCFPSYRIRFYTVNGPSTGSSFGTCFVYLGPHENYFRDVFRQFGTIVKAIR